MKRTKNPPPANQVPVVYPLEQELEASLRSQCGGSHMGLDHDSGDAPPASVIAGGSEAIGQPSRARWLDEPETIFGQIAALPARWMRHYAAALFRCGGIATLARKAIRPECGGISHHSVDKAARECPLFAQLIAEAQADGDGLVAAAVLRGATIGDMQPIYQGGVLVGQKRVRSPKDAELWMRQRGMLAAEQADAPRPRKVALVTDEEMPAVLAEVTARLFAARQQRVIDV